MPDARHIAVKNSTDKASAAVARSLQAALERVYAEITKVEKVVHAPAPVSDAKALGVLLGLQRMSDKERRERALRCIKAGDEVAAAAILNASELATGFSTAELAEVRSAWQQAKYPDEMRR
jgi:hypothetical protein